MTITISNVGTLAVSPLAALCIALALLFLMTRKRR